MNEINKIKNFSELNTCPSEANHQEKKTAPTITGKLTSRIETKKDYYYGFFKLENHQEDTPVIFKIKTCRLHEECQKCPWGGETNIKPNILIGTLVELTGTWANSNKERPSFTCYQYNLLKEPDPPTLQSLQKLLQPLLSTALKKKQEWTTRTDFLFKEKKDLEEVERIAKLGPNFLQAYLLTKQAFYANYQTEHLEQANFNLESYLQRIASELERESQYIQAYLSKEVK